MDTVACPYCSAHVMTVPHLAGTAVSCPACMNVFTMPTAEETTPPEKPVPPPQVHPVVQPIAKSFCRNCASEVSQSAVACMKCGLPPRAGNAFCQHCAAATHPQAVVCVKCGAGLVTISSHKLIRNTKTLDPALAVVLSLVLVGLPQMIVGQTVKGIAMLVGAIVIGALTGCLAAPVIWAVAAIDAFRIAQKLQQGHTVGEWEFF